MLVFLFRLLTRAMRTHSNVSTKYSDIEWELAQSVKSRCFRAFSHLQRFLRMNVYIHMRSHTHRHNLKSRKPQTMVWLYLWLIEHCNKCPHWLQQYKCLYTMIFCCCCWTQWNFASIYLCTALQILQKKNKCYCHCHLREIWWNTKILVCRK